MANYFIKNPNSVLINTWVPRRRSVGFKTTAGLLLGRVQEKEVISTQDK